MKKSKVLIPLTLGVLLGILKLKNSGKEGSDIAEDVTDATIYEEKSFGGLSQSAINELIKHTSRAVKAVIDGDILEYFYSSGSGKHIYSSRMSLDSEGKLNYEGSPFQGGNAPAIFVEKLINAINENDENL